jgi:fatty acid desaturase
MTQYELKKYQIIIELLRPWLLLSIYIILAYFEFWYLAVPFAFITILAGFVQMHDTMHSALNLNKKMNSFFLTISGLLLLKSGHAMKITHLRHHGKCLSQDDPEGEPANWKFRKVLLQGPYHIFLLRKASLEMAPRTRKKQLIETSFTLFLLAFFIFLYFYFSSLIGIIYWIVAFIMSATMPIWATYIPHHLAPKNPLRLLSIKYSGLWTPVISSFAFHHVHHDHPKVPTALLPKIAKEKIHNREIEG